MSATRGNFLSAFLPSFTRALRNALPGKRGLILLLVLAIPPIIALVAASRVPLEESGESLPKILMRLVLFLFLQFLVPLCGLLLGTVVLMHEASSGNLPYLFTQPTSRSGIVLGRFAAVLLVGFVALGLSLSLTLAALADAEMADGFAARAMLTLALSLPAYVAVFAALSVFTRWALVAGFLYTFGVEGFIGQMPGMLREGTLLFYTRSMIGGWEYRFDLMERFFGPKGAPDTATCVTVLLAVTAVGVAALCLIAGRKEFAARDPGTA